MSDMWQQRAQGAVERKNRLRSFGPYAFGLIVNTKHGLFAVDVEDNSVTAELLHKGSYADVEFEILLSFISQTSDVLIVGSHIGGHAVPLSRKCRHLTAIEANPNTFVLLKANILLNECKNIKPFNIAASNKSEKVKFVLSRENSGGSKIMPLERHIHYFYDDPDIIEIEAVSLDSLLGTGGFDLILMDIEGSEYFALKGMQGILANSKALAVEFLPHHLMDIANVSPEDFLATISPHFDWMYLRNTHTLVPKELMAERLVSIYNARECHDLIYFLKGVSPDWLKSQPQDNHET